MILIFQIIHNYKNILKQPFTELKTENIRKDNTNIKSKNKKVKSRFKKAKRIKYETFILFTSFI